MIARSLRAAAGGLLAASLTGGCASVSLPGSVDIPGGVTAAAMHLEDGVPLVEVHLHGHGPYRFLLDTGTGAVVLAREVAEEIGLRQRAVEGTLQGANDRSRSVGRMAHIERLRLGDATFGGFEAFLLARDDIGEGFQHRVDGILGFNVFRDCLLVIDYPRQQVQLRQGALPQADGRTVLPMRLERATPRVALDFGDGAHDVLIDSGNDQSFILPAAMAESLVFHEVPVPGPLFATITGPSRPRLARLHGTIGVGHHRIVEPIVALLAVAGASMGAQVLRHFTVAFDQQRQVVAFVRQNDAPWVYAPRSTDGVGVRRDQDMWRIADLVPGTPAEVSGLRVGDRVLAMRRRLHHLWLRVERDGGVFDVRVPVVSLVE